MEQQEAVAAGHGVVPLVQLCNALRCSGEESRVAFEVLGRCIDPVGKHREMKVALRASEMMDLQPLDLLLDRLVCRQ